MTNIILLSAASSSKLYNHKIPILIHGYDYAVPDGRGVRFLVKTVSGPWFKPAFKKKGYRDLAENTKTIKKLTGRFNEMLSNLSAGFPHVHHVDVRKSLKNSLKNELYKDYWANEFHPTDKEFKLVAKKFHKVIKTLKNSPKVR